MSLFRSWSTGWSFSIGMKNPWTYENPNHLTTAWPAARWSWAASPWMKPPGTANTSTSSPPTCLGRPLHQGKTWWIWAIGDGWWHKFFFFALEMVQIERFFYFQHHLGYFFISRRNTCHVPFAYRTNKTIICTYMLSHVASLKNVWSPNFQDVDLHPYLALERGIAPLYRSPQERAIIWTDVNINDFCHWKSGKHHQTNLMNMAVSWMFFFFFSSFLRYSMCFKLLGVENGFWFSPTLLPCWPSTIPFSKPVGSDTAGRGVRLARREVRGDGGLEDLQRRWHGAPWNVWRWRRDETGGERSCGFSACWFGNVKKVLVINEMKVLEILLMIPKNDMKCELDQTLGFWLCFTCLLWASGVLVRPIFLASERL